MTTGGGLLYATESQLKVLDIGCGSDGTPQLRRFLSKNHPDAQIIYADSHFNNIAQMQARLRLCADATKLPFPDGSFDLVVAAYIQNFGIDPESEQLEIFCESFRVLRDVGIFIVTAPLKQSADIEGDLRQAGFRSLTHITGDFYGAVKQYR